MYEKYIINTLTLHVSVANKSPPSLNPLLANKPILNLKKIAKDGNGIKPTMNGR